MTPTKNDIKKWLKTIKKDREWLAKQCGLNSKQSVDNWFAAAGKIPKAKLLLIRRLMAETQPPPYEIEGKDNMGKLFITLNPESQDAVLAECRRLNITLSSYCSLVVEWCATTPDGHAVVESIINGTPLPSVIMNLDPLISGEKESARKQFVPVEPFPAVASLDYNAQVVGNTAAGKPSSGETVPQDIRIYRPLEWGEFVLRVNGKSMEPEIPDESLVIIKKYEDYLFPAPGSLVVYNEGNDYTLKKLARRKNPETGKMEYFLKSINPDYKDVEPIAEGKISGVYVETLDRWEKA